MALLRRVRYLLPSQRIFHASESRTVPSPASDPSNRAYKSTSQEQEQQQQRQSSSRSWIQSKLRALRQELKLVPPLAKTLGLAGAIPFVALAPPIVYILPLPDLLYSTHADAQAAYGATILSFLGGPHWGLAMAEHMNSSSSSSPKQEAVRKSLAGYTTATTRYVWSVTPCLLGWFALLLPSVSKLCVLIPSFGLALAVDLVMASQNLLPAWYLPLRILLTVIAILSMGSTLLLLLAKNLPQTLQQAPQLDQKEKD